MTIGDNVAGRRRTLRLTQEALAERAGVSVETVRKLEQNGRTSARMSTLNRLARAPRLTVLAEIAEVLKVPTVDLLSADERRALRL